MKDNICKKFLCSFSFVLFLVSNSSDILGCDTCNRIYAEEVMSRVPQNVLLAKEIGVAIANQKTQITSSTDNGDRLIQYISNK